MNARWAILMTVAIACAVAAVFLFQKGPQHGLLPTCLFHRFTGLHCPGCGMTRATHALLHGHLWQAFRFNPLGVLLFPTGCGILTVCAVSWANRRPQPHWVAWTEKSAGWLAVLVIAFWVLRNLPWWPFTLLAPTSL